MNQEYKAKELNEFYDYVLSFYGHGEIYDISATRDEVIKATGIRINTCNENEYGIPINEIEFQGDSFDREYVRDIILNMRKNNQGVKMNHIDLYEMCVTDLNVEFEVRQYFKEFNRLELRLARKVLTELNGFIDLKEQDHKVLKRLEAAQN